MVMSIKEANHSIAVFVCTQIQRKAAALAVVQDEPVRRRQVNSTMRRRLRSVALCRMFSVLVRSIQEEQGVERKRILIILLSCRIVPHAILKTFTKKPSLLQCFQMLHDDARQ
jgi:hypothetical protein